MTNPDNLEAERAAPDEYEYGPEGMPRVKRMPSAVLDCIIDHSLFRYLGGALEGEDRDRLYGLMHDTANEALARISAWPVAPAVGEDGLPPLPTPMIAAGKNFDDFWAEHDLYTAEQYRQGQRDAVAADRVARRETPLTAAELADPEYMRGYVESQNESFADAMAEIADLRAQLVCQTSLTQATQQVAEAAQRRADRARRINQKEDT